MLRGWEKKEKKRRFAVAYCIWSGLLAADALSGLCCGPDARLAAS